MAYLLSNVLLQKFDYFGKHVFTVVDFTVLVYFTSNLDSAKLIKFVTRILLIQTLYKFRTIKG